ncbi:acetylornithine transaminase [Lysinibacter sp. HNR]|uniref:acetylornithine transaminase n=1 Tax=Lysinibacter sp. HNR TaxID=3031408 RepID=UPI002435CC6C|nr:acetylornithine transaminase [Lysinibacter sp. HNR]WGD37934.1 acetylornithine transaminase [Lysinibacter sp. HNR]
MTDQRWKAEYKRSLVPTFNPSEVLSYGSGSHVYSESGKSYLDFLGGIAVNSLGHNHPDLVAAVSTQAAQMIHVSNLFASRPQIELAETIIRHAGVGESARVFFANSGTEANEAAFKLARLHGGTARPRILSLENSFHGRSMGALALTGKPALHAPFEPMPAGVVHIPATLEALELALGGADASEVAAIIVEPIQGEDGVHPLPHGYLQRARELTTRAGALLIIDEIQTGVARTGSWFAFQHEGIIPDAFTLAKGLGGGVPVGALVTVGQASTLFTPGSHGTTFGGNPLATAAAKTVLDVIERDDLVAAARVRGAEITDHILTLNSPFIEGVRGSGLLLGIALTRPVAQQLVAAALECGLIINAPNPSTLRLAPPLTVTPDDTAEFRVKLGRALTLLEDS